MANASIFIKEHILFHALVFGVDELLLKCIYSSHHAIL